MNQASYAFRTLIGPWGVVVAVGLELANLFQYGSPWRGEFLWAVEWMAIALFLAGPMLAGLAAVDASRIAREDTLPVAAAIHRPRAPFLFAVVWTALPVSVAHVVAFLAATVVGGSAPPEPRTLTVALSVFLVQIGAIWWYAFLGSAVGRFMSPVAAGIGGTLIALGLFYVLSWGRGFLLLDLGASTVSRLGLMPNWRYTLFQGIVLVVMMTLLLWTPIPSHQEPSRVQLSSITLLVVLVAVVTGSRVLGPTDRMELAQAEPPTLCYAAEPTICVYQEHQRVAEQTVEATMALVQAARDNGYDFLIPRAVHETSWSYRPSTAAIRGLVIPTEVLAGDEWNLLELAQTLLTPMHCRQVFEDDSLPEEYFGNLETLVVTWVLLVEDQETSVELVDVPPDLREGALSPDDALAAKSYLDSCGF